MSVYIECVVLQCYVVKMNTPKLSHTVKEKILPFAKPASLFMTGVYVCEYI
jgi:hypothetical protein